MIYVVAKQFVQTDKLDEFLKLAQELVEKTTRLDAGCIAYAMYQDLADPSIVTVLETWESQDALDKHSNSPHFLELIPQIGAFCSKPPELSLYKKLF